jgi:hypothetical protein
MLKKIAIALVAAGLIAAPALAQTSYMQAAPAAKSAAASQARSATAKAAHGKQVKSVRYVKRHHRGKHIARVHVKRHAKRVVHHKHVCHYAKPAIQEGRLIRSSRIREQAPLSRGACLAPCTEPVRRKCERSGRATRH